MIQLFSTCFSQNSNEFTQFTQACPHHEGRIREQESTQKSTELLETQAWTWNSISSTQYCACMRAQLLIHVQLFVIPWKVTCCAPLSLRFSRQEYWSRLLFPPPGDLPNQGIKPVSPVFPAQAGRFITEPPRKSPNIVNQGKSQAQVILRGEGTDATS